jgi:hypothetical protein
MSWYRRPRADTRTASVMAATVEPGLCASCRHHRVVESRRGSRFWLCARSRVDPAFPRYPRLPVLACRGYEPGPPPHDEPEDSGGE